MRKEFLPFAKPMVSEEAIADVADSIRKGWLAMGPKTVDFEQKFADYVGCKFGISVNSATAGLHLAAMALIEPGDEVITTPMTFASTVNAIVFAGGKPVLVDIDPHTFNIDINKIEEVLFIDNISQDNTVNIVRNNKNKILKGKLFLCMTKI